MKTPIYVIGHRNPDTDSVCSAVCYARFKTIITGERYIPKRAGHLNEETQFVFKNLGIKPPEYMRDVRPQVKDVDIHFVDGVDENISIKQAWEIMKKNNVVTLPIASDGILKGLVTIGDISRSYFEVYDSNILSVAKTRFENIVDTLKAKVVTGDTTQIVDSGKVVIAAANPDLMEQFINKGDIVILGNRYEAQLCAIEMDARCIVICEGAAVSKTIIKVAQEKNCAIIVTDYDTYTVARLINQSIPISYYMMHSEGLITFKNTDFIEDIQDVMAKKRFRDFPITDENGKYIGMISRRNLLKHGKKKLILVDHNERSQAVDNIEEAEILEILDHHRIGSLETFQPIMFRNQPVGCTATIMYEIYAEKYLEIPENIAGLLCAAILSDTLMFRSPTCTERDKEAAQELAKIAKIEIESFANKMFRAGSNLSSKTPEEIFYQDYKKFIVDDLAFGVGQISFMSEEELQTVKDRLMPYMEKECGKHGIKMVFFMLTNIIKESTELLCYGEGSDGLVYEAFGEKVEDSSCRLEGVVSRKKQLIPKFMNALQQ